MSEFIAALDNALLRGGSNITLRRITGTVPTLTNVDVTVRAAVRNYQPHELVGGIAQGDSEVIISPTQILAGSWPSGDAANMPKRGDRIILGGAVKNIEAVDPIIINGELVRINLQVRGSSLTAIPVVAVTPPSEGPMLDFSVAANSQYIGQVA